ncbi:MAG: hypothetical protein F6K56_04250 [Moorea sp. SIO3G5]|nr:hypothetical protein [Moorena sp. SIO3G5]
MRYRFLGGVRGGFLCPVPCSLFPVPCSLKPGTLYLTKLKTAILQFKGCVDKNLY